MKTFISSLALIALGYAFVFLVGMLGKIVWGL
jgi:hypothetical protein